MLTCRTLCEVKAGKVDREKRSKDHLCCRLVGFLHFILYSKVDSEWMVLYTISVSFHFARIVLACHEQKIVTLNFPTMESLAYPEILV